MNEVLYIPNEEKIRNSNMFHFMMWLNERIDENFVNYNQLHQWSINNIENFWELFLEYSEVVYHLSYKKVLNTYEMPGGKWFEGLGINFAENIMVKNHPGIALQYFTEIDSVRIEYKTEYNYNELKNYALKVAAALKSFGVTKGERVAGYVANVPESIIAALGCAVIGAVWSSASPDFGFEALYDRFSQIQPKLVFVSLEYLYNGKVFNNTEVVDRLQTGIESIKTIVSFPSPLSKIEHKSIIPWEEFLNSGDTKTIVYESLPFDHPLYIMFSSGTTGEPKCMVHSTGGTLIQHIKEHRLHCDLHPGDKLLYYTTTGWMMWNWQLSALASWVTVCLYDGSPAYPQLTSIWQLVDKQRITHFGTSGRYIESCMKSTHLKTQYSIGEFENLKMILYTGSPLSKLGFKWIYDNIKMDVLLSGISGGTDIISCFVLGNPILKVEAGKIQCKGLGVDVCAFNEDGREVVNQPGELVLRKPIPSMPTGFLDDVENKKYMDAYFSEFENVWTHGDYIEFDENGSCIIYGRSDATLNPGGVRIGCSEIYSALDSLNYIKGSVAAGFIQPGRSDEEIVLFVELDERTELTNEIKSEIRNTLKQKRSPRHVPGYIFKISELPVTRSGKPVELAVKAILAGKEIKNKSALSNPIVLREIENIRLQLTSSRVE